MMLIFIVNYLYIKRLIYLRKIILFMFYDMYKIIKQTAHQCFFLTRVN